MMWALVWLGVAVLAGLCLIIFLPWVCARLGGEDWQERLSDIYIWFAQASITKSAIVVRDRSLELVPKRWDPDIGGDKDTEQGDPRHHSDPFDVVSRLANKPFGISLQERACYVSPLLAELGARARDAKNNNEIGVDSWRTEQDKQISVMRDGIPIPKRAKAVDLADARWLTSGSCEPEQGWEDYQKTKISQEKFHERISFGQSLIIILAFLGSMVVTWWISGQDPGGTTLTGLALLFFPFDLFSWFRSDDDDEDETADDDDDIGASLPELFGTDEAEDSENDDEQPDSESDEGDDNDDNETSFEEVDDEEETDDDEFEIVDEDDPSPWDEIEIPVGKITAVSFATLWLFGIPILALAFQGILWGIIVAIVMWAIPVVVLGGIALLGPSIPLMIGHPMARGFWILAQLTVDRGALVRRETGEFEHHMLKDAPEDDNHDYEVTLADGTTLDIEGSEGDLYRFGWAPLLVTEEKGEMNVGRLAENPPQDAATDGGEVVSKTPIQGYQPVLKVPNTDEWMVTLPQLGAWCRGTAETETIERGRNKALTEHGGQQQIGMIVLTIATLVATLLGAGIGLIAGGGI